jgi:hypothetical protein
MSDTQPPYGPSAPAPVLALIDGRAGRKVDNALTLTFYEGSEEPIGRAVQGGGDGLGKRLGILFGFKNGAAGRHVLTFADDSTLVVDTRDGEPSPVTRGDGAAVSTITRGATSSATLPDGTPLLGFAGHPERAVTPEKFRILVTDPAGDDVATLEVIRSSGGWDLGGELLEWAVFGGTQAGSSLPIPFQGTRLLLHRAVTPVEREVLLAACVDIGIGVRPYLADMGWSAKA